jgi:GntR family transcriptional regulator / MocR family aminotransferase
MELHLIIVGSKDLSGQVFRQLSEAIRSGRLADGQRLPPTRLLAAQLGISRKPVAEAYQRLGYEKLLVGQAGRGSFVSAPAPAATLAGRAPAATLAGHARLARWEALDSPLRAPKRDEDEGVRFDFIGGAPAAQHFPQDDWRRCILHGLRQEKAERGRYAPTEGVPALREALARHAAFARGVDCDAARLIVTNGAQQALDLLGRVLLEPGDCVALEDPGYPLARLLFQSQGARLAHVPVDAEGMVVERIPADARLIYVTPAHQFPLGMPMSEARKRALLARAREIGALIIEDDYDSEFRYEGRPADSLQSMDGDGVVAFVGTLSKVVLPQLRIGYLAAPAAILPALRVAKHLSDWHTATLVQHALARFIDDGSLLRHIRRGHEIYAGRRETLLRVFEAELAPWFELVPAVAGFHLAAIAREGLDVERLVGLARRAGVGLYSLAAFYREAPPRQGLLLGYGAIDTLDIAPALSRVREILAGMYAGKPH